MVIDYDLYDPWDEWMPGARERMTDDCISHMCGDKEDRVPYHEDDVPRFIAALLVAGEEPADSDSDAHAEWQTRAAHVLMQKYRHHWWYDTSVRLSPEYKQKARTCRTDVQLDELRKFYTWICKERREPWTDNLVPENR